MGLALCPGRALFPNVICKSLLHCRPTSINGLQGRRIAAKYAVSRPGALMQECLNLRARGHCRHGAKGRDGYRPCRIGEPGRLYQRPSLTEANRQGRAERVAGTDHADRFDAGWRGAIRGAARYQKSSFRPPCDQNHITTQIQEL